MRLHPSPVSTSTQQLKRKFLKEQDQTTQEENIFSKKTRLLTIFLPPSPLFRRDIVLFMHRRNIYSFTRNIASLTDNKFHINRIAKKKNHINQVK